MDKERLHRRAIDILFVVIVLGTAWFMFGCSAVVGPVAMFAAADATNAASMAKGDTADPAATIRQACYQAWANLAGGLASIPSGANGMFTAVEAGIEVQGTLQLPACQVIAGQVMLWVARKAPGGNLLP